NLSGIKKTAGLGKCEIGSVLPDVRKNHAHVAVIADAESPAQDGFAIGIPRTVGKSDFGSKVVFVSVVELRHRRNRAIAGSRQIGTYKPADCSARSKHISAQNISSFGKRSEVFPSESQR